MNRAPELKKMLFKALLTLGRSKYFEGDSYKKEVEFSIDSVNSKKLSNYKDYFGLQENIPLSYFYLLSQDVQTSQMVEKSFPLPIPGMIHLKSTLKYLSNCDLNVPITIISKVEIINRESGSLLPEFTETFIQGDKEIVEIKSKYLLRRKSKNKVKKIRKSKLIEETGVNWLASTWKLKNNLGLKYAAISGDYNPIHISTIFAWSEASISCNLASLLAIRVSISATRSCSLIC